MLKINDTITVHGCRSAYAGNKAIDIEVHYYGYC